MDTMTKSVSDKPIIVWFRQDLRLNDNPALHHAASSGKPVVALFVLDEASPDVRPFGAAQKWWLHHSLVSLATDLEKQGLSLLLLRGPAEAVIDSVRLASGADAIFWNRRYGAGEQSVDSTIKKSFADRGETARSFDGLLMHEPAKVQTGTGTFYRVYTPFWRNFRANAQVRRPLPVPSDIKAAEHKVEGDELDAWQLLPTNPDWSGGIAAEWTPGEAGADRRLKAFCKSDLGAYNEARDHPGPDRTSKLSPHLRFGELSPHQLWHACLDNSHAAGDKAREVWAKELVWREFSYHLLHHFPGLADDNFQSKFDSFPWLENGDALRRWQKGQTGYPIVDAGMRQMWNTGWMHNRVRMIVGSFLVKHLLIDWREGERWFWDCLVDGDPASNTASWQWVAGTGADAAPYFRIFNPMMQGEKFDNSGQYVRQYVPEIAALPDTYIHTPWEAPASVLAEAGITLGETYPSPIVDHKTARTRALNALNSIKKAP